MAQMGFFLFIFFFFFFFLLLSSNTRVCVHRFTAALVRQGWRCHAAACH